jgi:hypothetical protein
MTGTDFVRVNVPDRLAPDAQQLSIDCFWCVQLIHRLRQFDMQLFCTRRDDFSGDDFRLLDKRLQCIHYSNNRLKLMFVFD